MVSFSKRFPDSRVFNLLGDDIEVIKAGGGSFTIKGAFERKFLKDAFDDMMDVEFPVVECLDSVASTISWKDEIRFDGEVYEIMRMRPIEVGMTQIILKE